MTAEIDCLLDGFVVCTSRRRNENNVRLAVFKCCLPVDSMIGNTQLLGDLADNMLWLAAVSILLWHIRAVCLY